jgi:hypothetical protein
MADQTRLALIITHLVAFGVGVLAGGFGQFLGDFGTDRRRRREARTQRQARFEQLNRAMPALIAAMKKDLNENSDVRIVAICPSPGVSFHWSHAHFRYNENDYSDLRGKCLLLEEAGYLQVQPSNVPVYRMTDEFVQFLIEQ